MIQGSALINRQDVEMAGAKGPRSLSDRLAAARALRYEDYKKRTPYYDHCEDCWTRGRDAAIQAMADEA